MSTRLYAVSAFASFVVGMLCQLLSNAADVRIEHVGRVDVSMLPVMSLYITAVGQTVAALDWPAGVAKSTVRWIEYTCSVPPMVICMACLAGIHDLNLLVYIAGAYASIMLSGYVQDVLRQTRGIRAEFWVLFAISTAFMLHTWIMFIAFAASNNPPGFVWAILVVEFLLFCAWPFVHLLPVPPERRELIMTGMSIAAKTFLAVVTVGGLSTVDMSTFK